MNIRLLRITTGEEVVAEVVSEDEKTITVRNGLVVLPNQGTYGFAQWATVINPDKPDITVSKEFIIYNVEVAEPVVKQYTQLYGDKVLTTPPEKKLIL
ncbi:MAG: hypothetical protein CMG17_07260 [Candidatus Marinimicrobia bacterium]|jgi:hypothetical protein|nr:hypothetical protein [Candidatus Neomarinimicrobiota bacterium]|tara:strand:- start:373 stop:666 length:294 start_codon:yes stop_codon:yes gene_type:complete